MRSVDLAVAEGEFLTLLGPSGCGKSTLLRMVGGFELPSRGRVLLRGGDLTTAVPEVRPFNMVFQSYALFPHMTVAENVSYGPRIAGDDSDEVKRRVRDALELVHLRDFGERSVAELSGGQQQRVALARALVNEPEVLLLDEPLGALDLQLRRWLQDELRSIQRRLGTTFVYVTHDQEEALTLSHRIAVMERGELVQVSDIREVYERPATRFVAEFVGSTNLVDCTAVDDRSGRAAVRFGTGSRGSLPITGRGLLPTGEKRWRSYARITSRSAPLSRSKAQFPSPSISVRTPVTTSCSTTALRFTSMPTRVRPCRAASAWACRSRKDPGAVVRDDGHALKGNGRRPTGGG